MPEPGPENPMEREKPLTAEERDEVEVQRAAEIAREERLKRLVEERPIMGGQGEEEEEKKRRPSWEREAGYYIRGYGDKEIQEIDAAQEVMQARLSFRRLLSGLEQFPSDQGYDIFVKKNLLGTLDRRIWGIEEKMEKREVTDVEKELRKELMRMKDEVDAREAILIQRVIYPRAASDQKQLAKLFFAAEYSQVDTQDVFETLFKLPETREGEPKLGEKINMVMRWYVLIAKSANPEALKTEIAEKEWLRKMMSKDDIGWLISVGNIFAKEPDEETLKSIRQKVIEKVEGKKRPEDTTTLDRAAERIGWELFHIWGLATTFAPGVDEEGEPTLEGFPSSDDLIKSFYPKLRRQREASAPRGFPHGPDATVEKTPERFLVDFLHWLVVDKDEQGNYRAPEDNSRNVRSFWELWWDEGIKLGELPWGDPTPRFAWRDYMLRVFQNARDEKGVFELVTKELWKLEEIANVPNMRDFNKIIAVGVGPWSVTGGEHGEWFRQNPGRTWKDLKNEGGVLQKRIRDMIIEGAKTAANQVSLPQRQRWGTVESAAISRARELSKF